MIWSLEIENEKINYKIEKDAKNRISDIKESCLNSYILDSSEEIIRLGEMLLDGIKGVISGIYN